ncbi:MAG TPA: CcdB family protein [Magnetospirillum sp.]|nr:CcdB family protein [Magnetospirillum sp.]
MAQFDVYRNPVGAMVNVPFVVDVQSDHLARMPTRVVVPLGRPDALLQAVRRLNPVLDVDGESLILITEQASALPARVLGRKVASLAEHRNDIIAALDLLFNGI